MRLRALALVSLFAASAGAAERDEPALKTASRHPMQYYLSLPHGFAPGKKWPVVVVVEAAEKEFRENARRFVKARGDLPFIIVAPIIVTNGNSGRRDPSIYPYSPATWDAIDRAGNCAFDLEGLAQVLADVEKSYGGESKVFLTGFEAGAHLVWAMTFRAPERLRAAAPVAGNYIGRCMDDPTQFSSDPSRKRLPVRGFFGRDDERFGPASAIYGQWKTARDLAAAHGYENVSETIVPGKGHVPLPDEVLAFFASLAK